MLEFYISCLFAYFITPSVQSCSSWITGFLSQLIVITHSDGSLSCFLIISVGDVLGFSFLKMFEILNVGSKDFGHQDYIIFLLPLVVSLFGHTLPIRQCCYVTNRLVLFQMCSTDSVLCAHDSYIMFVFVLMLFCHVVYFLIDIKIMKCDFSAIIYLEQHLNITVCPSFCVLMVDCTMMLVGAGQGFTHPKEEVAVWPDFASVAKKKWPALGSQLAQEA